MQVVDHVSVAVMRPCGDVWMVRRQVVMTVRNLGGIVTRPERESRRKSDQAERGECEHCRHAAMAALQPAGQRIGDEPTGMRQRELRGE